MRFHETIEVKSNLHITVRERGKVVARRSGHNIWLNLGREFLAQVMSYSSFSPLTPERNDRVRYMGFGIGGTQQAMIALANAAPLSPAYAGANAQTDTDPTITTLERPVRLSGSSDPYPGLGGDVWVGQIQAPPVHVTTTQVTYSRLFTELEVSYNPFLVVPLSEIMLFTNNANPNVYNNTGIAYDTFDPISKTAAVEFEGVWNVRF